MRDGGVRGENYSSGFMAKNMIVFDYHGANAAGVPEVDIRAGGESILHRLSQFHVNQRVDGPANSSAFNGDCYLASIQSLSLLDFLKTRFGFCDPEIVRWVRVDANIRFRYGGGSSSRSSGHDDEGECALRNGEGQGKGRYGQALALLQNEDNPGQGQD